MEPVSTRLLTVAVGERTLALAPRLVQPVPQVLAPPCAPLWLTDGFRDSLTAWVPHDAQWMQAERRQGQGPRRPPRWRPLPQLLSAQVVTSSRRRRLMEGKHRVVVGTRATIERIRAKRGWTSKTSWVERLTLDLRQQVAAMGRRVNPGGKHAAG